MSEVVPQKREYLYTLLRINRNWLGDHNREGFSGEQGTESAKRRWAWKPLVCKVRCSAGGIIRQRMHRLMAELEV